AGAAGDEILALAGLRGGSCNSGDQDQADRKPACNGINACPIPATHEVASPLMLSAQCANGSGRSWKRTTLGSVPLPPSTWKGVRFPNVDHRPRPLQPAFASSMRPSIHLA